MPSSHSSNVNVVNHLTTTLGSSPPTLIDSGSTGHYFAPTAPLHNVKPARTPIKVQVASQQHMHSTHTAELPIKGLPTNATVAHIFPNIHTSLLAVAPLCNNGYQVTFDKLECVIYLPNGNVIQAHAIARGYGVYHHRYSKPTTLAHCNNKTVITTLHTPPQTPSRSCRRPQPSIATPIHQPTLSGLHMRHSLHQSYPH